MKKTIIGIIIIVLICLGIYMVTRDSDTAPSTTIPGSTTGTQDGTSTATTSGTIPPGTPTDINRETILGSSFERRNIMAYHYGSGTDEILFIGGIHGGYSWNTALVAYEMMDYLDANPTIIPANVKVTVIPVLNPDGLYKVTAKDTRFVAKDITASSDVKIAARFNARNVDLNRNFDCDWQANAKWQNRDVSGGTSAFSEPESQNIRDYVADNKPKAVVIWYSAAGGVFASNCHNGVSNQTTELVNVYAKASGYPAYEEYNYYEITGDMANWFAKMNIPAISVLLTDHENTEWAKNKAGIDAVIKSFAK